MKKTRKWGFVAQEAKRLADLGLAPVDIAARLNVERSTVQRWMQAGKIRDTRRDSREGRTPAVNLQTKPGDWSSQVRSEYALDATDDQLVTMAETAISFANDPSRSERVRLAAMREFRGSVKQLALVTRKADQPDDPAPASPPARPRRDVPARPAADPRSLLH